MKLRYIFSAILASALIFSGCEKTNTESFDNIKLEKTFYSIPQEGGDIKILINTTDDWKFVVADYWPEELKFKKENGKRIKPSFDKFGNVTNLADVEERTSSWLKADKMEGPAGETTVTLSAEAAKAGRQIEIAFYAGNNKQYIRVVQGSLQAVKMTCTEIKEKAVAGGSYLTSGTVTRLGNYAKYGAFYLTDGKTEIQVYGQTDDSKKAYPEISVGDYVELSGTWTSYGNLDKVELTKHVKSLIEMHSDEQTIEKEGGQLEVKVAYKGNGVFAKVMDECADWVSYVDMKYVAGVPSKLHPHPADTALVKFNVAENKLGGRKGKIAFASHSGNDNSEVIYEFTQKGAIVKATVDEFLAAPVGSTQYRVTGIIRSIKPNATFHNAKIVIAGGTGNTVELYRAKAEGVNIEELGLKVGDLVTFVGKRGEFKGNAQMAEGGLYESHEHYEAKTTAEFLALPDDKNVKYMVEGRIVALKDVSAKFNNAGITIEDVTGQLYCHRVSTFDKTDVTKLNLAIGGTIKIAGPKGSYKGSNQMAQGGFVVEYTAAM